MEEPTEPGKQEVQVSENEAWITWSDAEREVEWVATEVAALVAGARAARAARR
jgi:hypothetical protein